MRTILKIFSDDIRSLLRRFFATAVIIAISILPALYAWVNIYANSDPYGNTGNIKIALASYDPGVDLDDGTHVNMADEVLEEMKSSDSIDWQFPVTPTDAINGVKSGEYYAAIVFKDNFTYNMYNFEHALIDSEASLIYYENQKANAIAPKITETAANTLQDNIKTKYLETVFSYVFDRTEDIAEQLEDGELADDAVTQLNNLKGTLQSYVNSINSFTVESKAVQSGLKSTSKKLDSTRASARKSASQAQQDYKKARASLQALNKKIEERKKVIEDKKKELEDLKKQFPDIDVIPAEQKQYIEDLQKDIESLEKNLESLKTIAKALDVALEELGPLQTSMTTMLDNVDPVLDSASITVGALDTSLRQMQNVFNSAIDDIDNIIDKVRAASEDEKLAILAELLGGDPAEYAAFFSSLVNVDVEQVYSVESYGAAMAPFYSVLAIWVGGVISVAILNTHIDRKKYPGVTEAQAYFGRFLMFFLVGQLQAAITVAGDIYLLNCAPVHPGLMYLVAAITSLVFTLLIYSLTLSFGDIGKAMVVVLMVIQIAGSSGSYPIEILPPIFGDVYKFFPFPYAIYALREALCGIYGNDLLRYLIELGVFGVIGLVIGLFVRKPFIGINHFVSEKIEETELL